jgi:two-component system, OmpR family, sensor kinase
MAVRYGGRYEFEGGAETLSLPAEDVSARDERQALRKELDEARKQGEAYARELAAVFAQGEEMAATSQSSFPPATGVPTTERFAIVSRFAGGIAAELRALLSPLGREIQSLKSMAPPGPGMSSRPPPAPGTLPPEGDERVEGMRRRLVSVQDFLSGLAAVGEIDPAEGAMDLDLADLARTAVRGLRARVERYGGAVDIDAPEVAKATTRAAPRGIAVLLREIVAQAIAATSRGGRVKITITAKTPSLGARITVDDSGPALPASARRALLGLELDPGTYGRPTAVPLYVGAEIAAWQGGLLERGDAPIENGVGGGLRVTVTFPR